MLDPKLSPEQHFELRKLQLRLVGGVFLSSLGVMTLQNILPLAVSTIRRPPDSVLSSVKESNLLLTGAVAGGMSLILGYAIGKEVKPNDTISAQPNENPVKVPEDRAQIHSPVGPSHTADSLTDDV